MQYLILYSYPKDGNEKVLTEEENHFYPRKDFEREFFTLLYNYDYAKKLSVEYGVEATDFAFLYQKNLDNMSYEEIDELDEDDILGADSPVPARVVLPAFKKVIEHYVKHYGTVPAQFTKQLDEFFQFLEKSAQYDYLVFSLIAT